MLGRLMASEEGETRARSRSDPRLPCDVRSLRQRIDAEAVLFVPLIAVVIDDEQADFTVAKVRVVDQLGDVLVVFRFHVDVIHLNQMITVTNLCVSSGRVKSKLLNLIAFIARRWDDVEAQLSIVGPRLG